MSLPHITSVNLLISQTELCSTPALLPIYPNSTFEQIVSPCLAKVLIPSLPIIIALTAFIALCVQNFLFRETLNGCRLFIGKLVVLKALISFFAAFISLIDVVLFFAWPAYLGPSPVLPEQQNSAFIGLAMTFCLLIVYAQCICLGVVSSGFLHLAWFLRFASLIPDNVLSFANSQRLFNEVPSNYSLISQFLLAILMTFLLCWADSTTSTDAQYQRLDGQEGRKEKKQCPESSSSALNCLFFWYTGQMIWRGLRGSVDFDDLWTLDKCFQSGYLRSRFHRIQRVCAGRKLNPALFLFRLFLCVWEWNCLCVIAAVFVVLGNYANAMFLRLIVLSVTAGNPIWLSLTFMVLLFFTDFGDKLVVIRRDFASFRAYLNLRSVLTTQIFDKMIRLSSASHIKYSVGEIQNYLNNDVFHVRSIFFDVCDFVNCPLTVLIAFFGLYMELGVNAFYGLIILVVVFPVNYALTKLSSRLEDKLLKIKDERLKLINDVLSGMRVLKLYAWEESMEKLISKLRKRELYVLRQTFLMDAAINVSFQLAPLVATLISFYGYTVVQGNPLRPDVAFVSLLFFGMLRISIYTFPRLLTDSIKAWVSSKRLVEFLNAEEKQPSHILRENQDPSLPVVSLRDCSFSWTGVNVPDPNLQLQNISLEVQPGELIGIVGRVGSGKSSLLSAIIGEMERMEDKGEAVVRAKTVGYAPQQPWIQNKTLRSNVLFDSPFNESKYTSVINACSMGEDLKLLPAGDFTEIGEKGINLSGGQKARVALARAVYMDAELYVLDDTLSAVDAHVGAAIFANVIGEKGLLANKTRLWALNSLAFLHYCTRIVVMDKGEIYAVGTLKQLTEQKEGPFADLIREFMEKKLESQRSKKSSTLEVTLDDEEDSELSEVLGQLSGSPLSESLLERRRILEQQLASSEHQQPKEMVKVEESGLKPTETQASHQPSHQSIHQHRTDGGVADISEGAYVGGDRPEWTEVIGRLTKEEELATGIVSRRIYLVYFRSFGILLAIIYFILTFFGVSTSEALSSVWLAKWSSAAINNTAESLNHLLIYGGFNLVSIVSTAICSIIVAVGAYSASTYFHGKLVSSLFHSPMSFFDQTPMGRIMNRLSYDIARIDENIPWAISYAMSVFAEALNSLIAICFVIPVLVVVVVPLLVIFLGIIHFYNVASVHFRRLTSKATSSNCSFFQDSNLGADSIRVFNVVERFRDKSCYICDFMNESLLTEIYSNRWLQSRLDFISDSAVFICVFVAIIMADYKWISLGVLAMVINNGYIFTGYLGQIARVWRESEVQMVCIERVTEYINNEREPEWNTIDESRNWPPSGAGHLQFKDVCLRYRNELDLVLNNVNFDVRPGEKVGIVGRTGAGKSSLTLALFRIVDPCSGKILINGIDICTLGLHDLRGSLTIIPQDPVLFCGTLRLNLDPFDEYKDASLWEALEKAHLAETIREIEGGLDYKVAESGANLSVGQRQLVCMARAVLRQKTCILVLDEATAAIDPETDSRIQLSIRSHFKKCTILTIAHRLNTIIDYDRVLVMDAGKVAEFDSPNILLKDSDSLFFKLAKQAGISQSEKEEI